MTDHPRSDAERARLAAEYPDWLIGWPREPDMVDACWFATGWVRILDTSFARLRLRIAEFQRVFDATHDSAAAEKAAKDLNPEH